MTRRPHNFIDIPLAEIAALYDQDARAVRKLAAKYGVHRNTIYQKMQRAGLQMRSQRACHKAGNTRSAEHPRWRDDRMVREGYARIRVGKEHPLAYSDGFALEHIVIWVAAGNTPPAAGEIIHHRNGIKTDNRIENLERLTRAEHNRLHNAERGRCPTTGRLLRRVA